MSTDREPARGAGEWAELVTTERCNQRCLFCYAQHRPENPDPDLTSLRTLFTEARVHTSRIILCGREALLRPDILDVLELARELGLGVGIATNGQALARAERVEAISLAGVDTLQVSFHFPDRATFATWTQSDPAAYDRVLAGLRNVRDHNRAHPERRLGVATETEMAVFNEGRLAEILATLREALGESFTAMRLGALIPTPMETCPPGGLLEPIEARRRELAELLALAPPGLDLKLDKAPLCLLPPGEEHRSLGVWYLVRGARLLDNHAGVELLADDVVAVNTATEIAPQLRANPYRAVCRTCALLAACRSNRTDWAHPAFAPTRAQKPAAVHDRTLGDVLRRVPGADEADILAALATLPGPGAWAPFPEEDLLAAVRALPSERFRVTDWFVDGAPVLALELAHATGSLALRLEAPGWREGELGLLVDYLSVEPATGSTLDEALQREAVRFLAAATLPAIEAWADERTVDTGVARLFRAAWQTLGERLWPGASLGPWRTTGVRFERARGLIVALRGADDRALDVPLGDVATGLDLAALGRVWPEAPATPPRGPAAPDAARSRSSGAAGPARPCLIVEFVAPGEPDAPHRFRVEVARPGERYAVQRGGLGAWYRNGDRFDASSRPLLNLLGSVLERAAGRSLDVAAVDEWSALLTRALQASRLAASAEVRRGE